MPKSAHAHEEEDTRCGVGVCKPRWAASLANAKLFVLSWCLINMVYLIGGAYVNGVLTTLEKRFGLQSRQLGVIASAGDIGSMATVLFVTYYGGKPGVSRPKMIGIGVLILALGAALSGLPHFIAPAYEITLQRAENRTAQDTCSADQVQSECGDKEKAEASGRLGWLALLLIAQVLYGAGGTPIKPLGTTYVDDQVSKANVSVYIGFSYVIFGLGLPLGFVLAAYIIKIYVDIDKGIDPAEMGLTSDNPMWVGAWWLGFFICAAAFVVVALPMFFFPVAMKKPDESEDAQEDEEDEKKSAKNRMLPMMDRERREPLLDPAKGLWEQIKGMIFSLKDILTNATFMMLVASGVCSTSVSGAYSFMPKYMEVQFGVPKSRANLLIAPIVLPIMMIGILGSGFIIRRFKLTPRQCVYMSMFCTFFASFGFVAMFFFSCPVPPMAGVTMPYGYSPYMPNAPGMNGTDLNLASACNADCSCSVEKYSPVCGLDGVTYFSPCHAGCTEKGESFTHPMGFKLSKYNKCSCLAKLPPEVMMKIAAKFGGKPGGNQRPGGNKPSGGQMGPTQMPSGGGMKPANGTQNGPVRNNTEQEHGPGATNRTAHGFPDSDGPVPGNPGNSTGAVIPGSDGQGGPGIPGKGPMVPGGGMPSFAIGAPCPQICGQWKYFLAAWVVTGFISSFGFIPSIIAILRALTPETKSFGMGVQIVFYRLIGFIPSPIYFGALIDSTCRLWGTTCGRRGACILYDLDLNRYYFLGLMVALRMCSIFFEAIAAHLFKKREGDDPKSKMEGATDQDIAASLGSLAGSIKALDSAGRADSPVMKDTEDLRMNIWKKRGAEDSVPIA